MSHGFVYLDTSVALAHLLAEDERPPDLIWSESLISSRLLEYEIWTRLNGRGLATSHGDDARMLLASVSMLELIRPVVARACEAFPAPVRTLDALHLASIGFLLDQGVHVRLASYDLRMRTAAQSVGVGLYPL